MLAQNDKKAESARAFDGRASMDLIMRNFHNMLGRIYPKEGKIGGIKNFVLFVVFGSFVLISVIQRASAQVQLGSSFDCSGTTQGIPLLVCQAHDLRIADVYQLQAYYTLRHAQPERQQELRNQFNVRIRRYVTDCSAEHVRASGSQQACVARELRELRNFWLQQLQQGGSPAALEEVQMPFSRFWEVQQELKRGGFLPADAVVDGVYGSVTRQAVSRFQAERGMPPSGFLTFATANALRGTTDQRPPVAPSAPLQYQGNATSPGAAGEAQRLRPQERSQEVSRDLEAMRQQQQRPQAAPQQQIQSTVAPPTERRSGPLEFGSGSAEGAPALSSGAIPSAGTAALTQGEIRGFADALSACWSIDPRMISVENIFVEVRLQIDGQGVIRNVTPTTNIPHNSPARPLYEATRRALMSPQCNPIPLPPSKYGTLMSSTLRFGARGLLR